MKAVLCQSFGPPENLILTDIPPLQPAPHEVIIEMRACSVNFPDTLIIENKYQFKPALPFSPGGEVAGVIKAVGSEVKHGQVGQRVFALCSWGGFAEEVAVAADRVFPMLPDMDFASAASVMYAYGTSYHALTDRANLQKGDTLLVLGAGGGVGLAAVELGKLLGATVIAAASSDEKLAACQAKGADFLINYTTENLRERIDALTNKQGVQVIYDPVGEPFAEVAVRCLAWKGRYLVVGFAGGEIPKIPLNLLLLKGAALVGVFWGRFAATEPEKNKQNLQQLAAYFRQGALRPHIFQTYTLAEAPQALRALLNREVVGKAIVLHQPDHPTPELESKVEGTDRQEVIAENQQPPQLKFAHIADLANAIGQEIGPTPWLTITQQMIDDFATTTIDEQWIHVDVGQAAQSVFGGTIAHGLLTLSLTPYFVGQLYEVASVKMGINYGLNRVRFLQPVPSGSQLRMRGTIKSVDKMPSGGYKVLMEAVIEGTNSRKPVCIAELISIMFE